LKNKERFILIPSGNELYCHFNAELSDDVQKLTAGIDVGFVEEQGDNEPHAASWATARASSWN